MGVAGRKQEIKRASKLSVKPSRGKQLYLSSYPENQLTLNQPCINLQGSQGTYGSFSRSRFNANPKPLSLSKGLLEVVSYLISSVEVVAWRVLAGDGPSVVKERVDLVLVRE